MGNENKHINKECRDLLREQVARFVSYNSHIIRAPLSRILSLADLCSNLKTFSESDQWMFKEINTSAQELDDVIRGIGRWLNQETHENGKSGSDLSIGS